MGPHQKIRRRRLPHWDVPGATYFVTTCLEGSIPAQGLLELARYRKELQAQHRPTNLSADQWANQQWKRKFRLADRWLDGEPAVRHLEDPRLAREVVKSLYHFAGQRYDLFAFVVMPSHYHWVFRPREEWLTGLQSNRSPRQVICHSINTFTARECNALLNQRAAFWQHESYDHWIRDEEEQERIMRYIEANPVNASLALSAEAWEFSSAHDRLQAGLDFGQPLVSDQASGKCEMGR